MDLPHNFEKQASSGGKDYNAPPYKIRGRDLDENFKMVKPQEHQGEGDNKAYRVSFDKDKGWELLFPFWPPPSESQSVLISKVINGVVTMRWVDTVPQEGTFVLGAVDGEIQWIETQDCAEEA